MPLNNLANGAPRSILHARTQVVFAKFGYRRRVLKALTTPYNRGHHGFAMFTASATFILIIAGALVTSNEAGLAVPDWPTSFGHMFKMPRMVGGIMYEHGHRMTAEFIGILTIVLAAWTWLSDHRQWMRRLGLAAFGTILLQGLLGGITVLNFLPPMVSTAHAMVGQTFFCIAVAIAIFTGPNWVQEQPKFAIDRRKPSLIALTLLSVFILYVQLALGGMFRHNGMSWQPHVINSAAVVTILTWTAIRTLSYYSEIEALRRPAIMILGLLMTQMCLGFMSFLTKVIWGAQAVQPLPAMILSTVAHVAVGALLLATTIVLAIQAWRHVVLPEEERLLANTRKAVTA